MQRMQRLLRSALALRWAALFHREKQPSSGLRFAHAVIALITTFGISAVDTVHAQEQGLYGVDTFNDVLVFIDVLAENTCEDGICKAELIGELGLEFDLTRGGADFDCRGTYWALGRESVTEFVLYAVDPRTGVATIQQPIMGFDAQGVGMEFGSDEETLYWRNREFLRILTREQDVVMKLKEPSNSLTVNPDCDETFYSAINSRRVLTRFHPMIEGSEEDVCSTAIDVLGEPLGPISSLASAPDGTIYAHARTILWKIKINQKRTNCKIEKLGRVVSTVTSPDGEVISTIHNIPGVAFGPREVTCTIPCPLSCPCTLLDFDQDSDGNKLMAGDIVAEQWAADGIHISTNDPENHPVMIFDGSRPTGDDDDLGTPNEDFGGSGIGAGGGQGRPGRNALSLGNMLIISEDKNAKDPNDYNNGGTIVFTFDFPVQVDEVHVVDVDSDETGGTVTAFIGGGGDGDLNAVEPVSRDLLPLGDNSFQVVPLGVTVEIKDNTVIGVRRLEVNLSGSGAVTAVVFCKDVICRQPVRSLNLLKTK